MKETTGARNALLARAALLFISVVATSVAGAQLSAPQGTSELPSGCVTTSPVRFFQTSLGRAAQKALAPTVGEAKTLCWRRVDGPFTPANHPSAAATRPANRKVGGATVSEWYETTCLRHEFRWQCLEPERKRSLGLEPTHSIVLFEGVTNEALPRLVAILNGLKDQLPPPGEIELPDCDAHTNLRKFRLGAAVNKLTAIFGRQDNHSFNLSMPEADSSLRIEVPNELPVPLARLCWVEILD